MQPTCNDDFKPFETGLAVSLELASGSWKMAMSDGKRDNPTIKTVSSALALERLEQAIDEIEKVKAKWGLARDVRTVVLYEAGQDGFWIARELMARGYEAVIPDIQRDNLVGRLLFELRLRVRLVALHPRHHAH